jgi:hypothetical protein
VQLANFLVCGNGKFPVDVDPLGSVQVATLAAELELELVPVALLELLEVELLELLDPLPAPELLDALEPLDRSEPELVVDAEFELPAPGELEPEAGLPALEAPLSELPFEGAVAVVAQP